MTNPNDLLHHAAAWFGLAIRQHVAEAPDQCKDWLELFQAGAAKATVTIEIVPEQQILCGFEIGEKVIVFHRTPLTQTGQSAVPH